MPFEDSFESIKHFVNIISGDALTFSYKYKLKIKQKGTSLSNTNQLSNNYSNTLNKELFKIEREEIFKIFSNLSTPKIRLYLWLNGLSDEFDFHDYKEFVWQLEREDQALFFKRLFLWKSLGKTNFTLKELSEIKVFNIEMCRDARKSEPEKNFINLDFNVSLAVYILNVIAEKSDFNSNKIFEYLIEYVDDNAELQYLDFFYPECCGRTRGQKKPIINKETKEPKVNSETGLVEMEYSYYHSSKDKPLFHKFCDGQKSKDNKLEYPKPYSWCAGLPCFDPSNSKTSDKDNWQDWSILEFLHELNIKYDFNVLSSILAYINKANTLLERLKCISCNKLMIPTGDNRYAYFLHNTFSCRNKSCSERNKTVYLNHCHNKVCRNFIDSRISKRCTHKENEGGGWYICDYCYSCCSTEALNKIRKTKESNKLNYNGPKSGHDELKKLFCYNCGGDMILDKDYYIAQLEIITKLCSSGTDAFVEKADENNGNWKFRLNFSNVYETSHNEGFQKLSKYGFRVTPANRAHLFFVDRLIAIAIKCQNLECSHHESFSPINSKWKAFNDSHLYLSDKVKKFYESGEIDYLE